MPMLRRWTPESVDLYAADQHIALVGVDQAATAAAGSSSCLSQLARAQYAPPSFAGGGVLR